MMRRAFTLLETMLACTIGVALLAVALAMFFTLDRTDHMLGVRFEQTGDLQRVRLVMQRTFLNILVSNRPPPLREPPPGEEARPRPRNAAARSDVPLTPRMSLDVDHRLERLAMTRRGDNSRYAVQRLEIVLTDAPVPNNQRDIEAFAQLGTSDRPRARSQRERKDEDEATPDRPMTPDEEAVLTEQAQVMVRAVRGAFEFWPQVRGGGNDRAEDISGAMEGDGTLLWELWWVPLAPMPETAEEEPPPSPPLPEAFLVASNIRYARWTMYDDRERKVKLAIARRPELPAYAELEIETGAGLYANWMFETDFAVGPESMPRVVVAPPATPSDGAAESPGSGGGSVSPGSGGGGAGSGLQQPSGKGKGRT